MAVIDDYKKLIAKKREVERDVATTEALLKQRTEALNAELAQAKATYGVSTIEELQALRDRMEAEMAKVVEEARAKAPELLT